MNEVAVITICNLAMICSSLRSEFTGFAELEILGAGMDATEFLFVGGGLTQVDR